MSEEKQVKWKERIKKVAAKIGHKIADVLHDAWDKLAKQIGPEVWAFVLANQGIIEKAIMDTMIHYASEPDHIKFEKCLETLKKELIEEAGQDGANLDIPDSWLGFGIHAVILLLKAQGKM